MCCALLCPAVPCCALLCCAVPCCAVLCPAALCCAALCCAALRCAVLCCAALLCCALLCRAVLCSVLPCALLRCVSLPMPCPCPALVCSSMPCPDLSWPTLPCTITQTCRLHFKCKSCPAGVHQVCEQCGRFCRRAKVLQQHAVSNQHRQQLGELCAKAAGHHCWLQHYLERGAPSPRLCAGKRAFQSGGMYMTCQGLCTVMLGSKVWNLHGEVMVHSMPCAAASL